jgi:hypothetical protein
VGREGLIVGPGPMIDPGMAANLAAFQQQGRPEPSKQEHRRVAALNFAIASQPGGYDTAEMLTKAAKRIEKYIDSGN